MSNGHAPTPLNSTARTVAGPNVLGPSRSGRRFVIVAVIALLAIWATMFLVFREWRSRHRELAAFGAREVAPLVDPLAEVSPPDVPPKVWKAAVRDSHDMLVALTASGLLDRPGMEGLRDDLRARFRTTSAPTAVRDLARLWKDMESRAGPILSGRSSRPPHPPARPSILEDPATSRDKK